MGRKHGGTESTEFDLPAASPCALCLRVSGSNDGRTASYHQWRRIRTGGFPPSFGTSPPSGWGRSRCGFESRAANPQLVGHDLLAIRRLDGTIHDLVEIEPEEWDRVMRELKSDTEIILELWNPVTLERSSMSWFRFSED